MSSDHSSPSSQAISSYSPYNPPLERRFPTSTLLLLQHAAFFLRLDVGNLLVAKLLEVFLELARLLYHGRRLLNSHHGPLLPTWVLRPQPGLKFRVLPCFSFQVHHAPGALCPRSKIGLVGN